MKRLALCFILSVFSFFLFCEGKVSVAVKPEIGILNGQIHEYVFSSYNGKLYMLSRLDWNVDSIFYGGLEIESVIGKGFSLSAGGRIGLPGRSGEMEDFDWTNGSVPTRNTHYSKHENYLLEYASFWASAGWCFYPTEKILLEPFFSLSRETFAFDGRYGYTQYAFENGVSFWSPDLPKKYCDMSEYPDNGNVISYSQQRYLVDLGLRTKINFFGYVDFSLYGKVGFFNQVIGHDYHWSERKFKEYVDAISGFTLSEINLGTEVSFILNKHNRISVKADIQEVPILQGDTYSKRIDDESWESKSPGGGGASSNLFSVSLNYTLTF